MIDTLPLWAEGAFCPVKLVFNDYGIVVLWYTGPNLWEPARDGTGINHITGFWAVCSWAKLMPRREATQLAKEVGTHFLGQVIDGRLVNIVLVDWQDLVDEKSSSPNRRSRYYWGDVTVPFKMTVDLGEGPRYSDRISDSWHG